MYSANAWYQPVLVYDGVSLLLKECPFFLSLLFDFVTTSIASA